MKLNGLSKLLWALMLLVPSTLVAYYHPATTDTQDEVVLTRVLIKLDAELKLPEIRSRTRATATGLADFDAVSRRYGVFDLSPFLPAVAERRLPNRLRNIVVVNVPEGQDIDRLVEAYQELDGVEYVEVDRLLELYETPSDSLYRQQWALHNFGQAHYVVERIPGYYNDKLDSLSGLADADIDFQEVYDNPPGPTLPTVVAIIDTGLDDDHPDLAGRVWINPLEIAGNLRDDDHNGYADDTHGWDFSGDVVRLPPPDPGDPTPSDRVGHGTHCAGIIGAVTDNSRGVAGVTPSCHIMPVKIFPNALHSVAARAVIYAVNNGADVINMSWGSAWYSQVLAEALSYANARGVVLCASTGNSGTDHPSYPAAYPEVIAVGATDSFDEVTAYSNYGAHLSLCAPGDAILSLRADSTDMYASNLEPRLHIISRLYYLASGTSMSSPFVAAAAAYLRSLSPGLMPERVREILENTADDLIDPYRSGASYPGWDEFSGHGRLNLRRAVLATPPERARIESPQNKELVTGVFDIAGMATGSTGNYTLAYGPGAVPGTWTQIATGPASVSGGVLATWNTTGLDGPYTLRLSLGTSTQSQVMVYVTNQTIAAIDAPAVRDTVIAWAEITGTASGVGFDSYVLQIGRGAQPDAWEAIDSATTPVVNGRLSTWYAGDLDDGLYTLRLTVFSGAGPAATHMRPVYLRSPFSGLGAWKVPLNAAGPALVANYGDFDGDGAHDIVIGTGAGIEFFSSRGESKTAGMPDVSAVKACQMPVVVGDLDGDGRDDLVAVSDDGLLVGITSSEQSFAISVPVPPAVSLLRGIEEYSFPSLFLRDIDGDNRDEIHYFPGWSQRVLENYYIFKADGTLAHVFPRYPYTTEENFFDYHAADLDGDGEDELYLAGTKLYSTNQAWMMRDSFDLRSVTPEFTSPLSMSAVDIDGDHKLELILLAVAGGELNTYLIYAFDEHLALKTGWPHDTGIESYWAPSDPVFCDIDRDGLPEYFISWFDLQLGRVSAWHTDGTPLSGHASYAVWATSAQPAKLRSPVIADLNADGFADVVTCATEDMFLTFPVERLEAWDHEGHILPGWPIITEGEGSLAGSGWRYATAIGDVDQDGRFDVMMSTSTNNLIFLNVNGSVFDSTSPSVPFWRYNRSLSNTAPVASRFEVVAVRPTKLTPRVSPGTNLSVTFNRDLDESSLDPTAAQVTGSISGLLTGTVNYNAPNRTLTFDPSADLVTGESVEMRVRGDLRSTEGFSLPRDFVTSFYVYAEIPEVIAVAPVHEHIGADTLTNIVVNFNTDLDSASFHDSAIVATGHESGRHPGSLHYDKNTRTATFQPHEPFAPAEVVTVTVAPQIRTTLGIGMTRAFSWSFSVMAPRLMVVSPTVNAVGVPRFTQISAHFDAEMPSTSIHDSTLIVYGEFSGRKSGAIGYVPETRLVKFTTTGGFLVGERATVVLPFSRWSWSFTVTAHQAEARFPDATVYDLGPSPEFVKAADIDLDKDIDLCVARSTEPYIWLLRNDGAGTLTRDSVIVGGGLRTILTGDLDGDGDVDLVAVDSEGGRLILLANDGTGTFGAWDTYSLPGVQSVFATDLNADGALDLGVARSSRAEIQILINGKDGTFTPGQLLLLEQPPLCVYPLDLENDGDLDLAAAQADGEVIFLHNNGRGVLAVDTSHHVNARVTSLVGVDVDRDGDADLAGIGDGGIMVLINDGTGRFLSGQATASSVPGVHIATADLDADGDMELLAASGAMTSVLILDNLGDGRFAEPMEHATGDTAWSVIAADLDSDGDLDLATGGGRAVSVLLNRSSAAVGEEGNGTLPTEFALGENYPNPFNPATSISFAVPEPAHVSLEVYNVLGQKVATLIDAVLQPGYYSHSWDGRARNGGNLPSGLYFYRLNAGSFRQTHKMLLLK